MPFHILFFKKKAFDSVPHLFLLNKLPKFGFESDFIILSTSYLDNCTQCVKINHSLSLPLPITPEVPQDSVLRALLFLFFINDLPDSVQHSHFFLFADDSKFFSSSCKSHIENDIVALFNWSMDNGLQFHPSKFKSPWAINFYLPFSKLMIWVSSCLIILAGINTLTLISVNVLKFTTS